MSEYRSGSTPFTNTDLLLKACAEAGLPVEVHATPQPLLDWHGQVRPDSAEIIIRRQHLNHLSNDLGFRWNAAAREGRGAYDVIISDYDRGNQNAGQGKLDRIKLAYVPLAIKQVYARRGARLVSSQDTGATTVLVFEGST